MKSFAFAVLAALVLATPADAGHRFTLFPRLHPSQPGGFRSRSVVRVRTQTTVCPPAAVVTPAPAPVVVPPAPKPHPHHQSFNCPGTNGCQCTTAGTPGAHFYVCPAAVGRACPNGCQVR